MVVVPVEACLLLFLQAAEEALLNFLQQVEAHKEVLLVFKSNGFIGCYLTVKGTLVGQSLLAEHVVVSMIDVAEVTPQFQKPLLQLCALLF